jgi:excisionase family DNA binding protein
MVMPNDQSVRAPLLVTTKEAKRLLSISHTALYGLISRGELESCLVGRSRRITMRSIEDFVERQLAQAACAGSER